MVSRSKFDLENDELLRCLLDVRYFQGFKESMDSSYKRGCQLELFITDKCNLKCSYCYLQKFGNELYPKNSNNSKEIINNLRILFKHFLSEGYTFYNIDLFSGEIWGYGLGNLVLDTLIEFISAGVSVSNITIPTNFSFMLDKDKFNNVESYIKKLSDVGCRLVLSASVDGKYLEDVTRPFKVVTGDGVERVRDDEFYENFFDFCHKYDYSFHPMVASHGIENWIDNYKWYRENVNKRWGCDVEKIMMLEVRNDDWDSNKIKSYLEFIDFLIEDKLKYFNGDVSRFTRFLFNLDNRASGYLPYCVPISDNHMPCTIQEQLTIRLGDLAIVGCHRISYDKFVFGYFDVVDDEIIGIKSNNVQVASKVLMSNPANSIHGCDRCKYRKLCMKGCFGSQYESTGELFMPVDSVCDLFRAKYDFLLNKYRDIGVWDEAEKMLSKGLEYCNIKESYDILMSILDDRSDF